MSSPDQQGGTDPRPTRRITTSFILPEDRRRGSPSPIETVNSARSGFSISPLDGDSGEPSTFAFSSDDLFRLNTAKSAVTNAAFQQSFGGLLGLEHGLRTDFRAGLGVDENHIDGHITLQSALEAAYDASAPSDEVSRALTIATAEPDRRASIASTAQSTIAGLSRITSGAFHSSGDESRMRRHTSRRDAFGNNELPPPKQLGFFKLVWINFKQAFTLLLAFMTALFTFTTIFELETSENTFGGAEAAIPGILVLFFSFSPAISDCLRRRKHPKSRGIEGDVNVIRSGRARIISAQELVVGDVVQLKQGDVAHADGLLITGCDVRVDESSITGEGKAVRKQPQQAKASRKAQHHENRIKDSVILSGSKILKGTGTLLVTAVGVNTVNGIKYVAKPTAPAKTPLQAKLDRLVMYIIKGGSVISIFFLVAQEIIWATGNPAATHSPQEVAIHGIKILMISMALLVVLVPEGLPVAVHFGLEFACGCMLKENIWVRSLASCETAGNATTILCDKTGTLTENEMTVVTGLVGRSFHLGSHGKTKAQLDRNRANSVACSGVGGTGLSSGLSLPVRECLRESIARNTMSHQQDDGFQGSATETSLLRFAKTHLAMSNLEEEESHSARVKMYPFSSEQKWMAVVVERPRSGGYRMLVKGAPEAVLGHCTAVLSDPENGDDTTMISDAAMTELHDLVQSYSRRSLRVIVLAHADLYEVPSSRTSSPSPGEDSDATDSERLPDLSRITGDKLTLTAILGIHDPVRAGVNNSVKMAQDAGVAVSVVTGDGMLTAKSIAESCNIYRRGSVVMEAWLYQLLTDAQLKMIAPRLHVLARSMPEDKARLVNCHQELGETVIVTGDGTNDAAALRAADVGFSMGRCGTEVAKESSDIVLLDDDFFGIVRAIAWGRQVNDVVKRFLQFESTPILGCAILTMVSAFRDGYDSSMFTVVQMLWINASMDIVAGSVLTRDDPRDAQMRRRPEPRNTYITTMAIRKMVKCQLAYQLAVILVLYYSCGGALTTPPIALVRDGAPPEQQRHTLVFNTFMFMQIFLLLNSRSCDNHKNIFAGMFRKSWNFIRTKWFVALWTLIITAQVLIVQLGGPSTPFGTVPLSGQQWALTIGLGVFTLPLGYAIRCMPDRYFAVFERGEIAFFKPLWKVLVILSSPFIKALSWLCDKLVELGKLIAAPLATFGRLTKRHARDAWRNLRHGRAESDAVLPTKNTRSLTTQSWREKVAARFGRQQSNDTGLSRASTAIGTPRSGTKDSNAGSTRKESGPLANEGKRQDVEPVDLLELICSARRGPVDGFEMHPDTDPDDPIVWQVPKKGGMPPSQREEVRMWLGPKLVNEE